MHKTENRRGLCKQLVLALCKDYFEITAKYTKSVPGGAKMDVPDNDVGKMERSEE